jgi:hypothetical protein
MATPRKLAQAAADQPGCGAAKPTQPRVYDQTIHVLKSAVRNAKLGRDDELAALKRLDDQARLVECHTSSPPVEALIAEERSLSDSYAGRIRLRPDHRNETVRTARIFGKAQTIA